MPYKSLQERRDYQKWYRKQYPEKVKVLLERWHKENPDWLRVYQKRYYSDYYKTENGKEVRRKAGRQQRLVNYDKVLARKRLNWAIECGKVKKGVCVECGNDVVHGHHTDYSKPLDVIWVCRKHHNDLHGRNTWK